MTTLSELFPGAGVPTPDFTRLAYGLALDGWGSSTILAHFYRGTAVQTPSLPKKTLGLPEPL